jgi:Ca-activated chloride channel family protein
MITEALLRFIALSNNLNEYFIVAFDSQPKLLLDWTDDASAIKARFAVAAEVKPKGNTALFDACYLGVEQLARAKYEKRMLMLITDGADNVSKQNFDKVRRVMRESGILVYAVLIRVVIPGGVVSSAIAEESKSTLLDLALPSAGAVWFPERKSQIVAAFESIALELRHQYVIGFRPRDSANKEKWRRIKLLIAPTLNPQAEVQHLSVRSRQGYYPISVKH